MQRTNRGFTIIELLLVFAVIAAIGLFIAWIIYAPWILLWCLKNMGLTTAAYTSEAWWGAFCAILLFTSQGMLGASTTTITRGRSSQHGPTSKRTKP